MKKSELKQLIREVIEESKVLKEEQRFSVKVTFDDGDYLTTGINGKDEDAVREYYRVGDRINVGSGPYDNYKTIADVTFLKSVEESKYADEDDYEDDEYDEYDDDDEDDEDDEDEDSNIAEILMDYLRKHKNDQSKIDYIFDKKLVIEYIDDLLSNDGYDEEEIQLELDSIQVGDGYGRYILDAAQGVGFDDEDHYEFLEPFLLFEPEDIIKP